MKDENDTNLLSKEGDTPTSIKEDDTTTTPDGFIQSLKLSQGHNSYSDYLLNIFCWFFSIVVWLLIGLIVYYSIYENNPVMKKKCIISLVFYYIVYIILQYYSPTFKYLLNKEKLSLKAKMGEFFAMKPEVILKSKSYHYIQERYSYEDNDGNRKEGTRTVRVWSGDYTKSMKYKSFRDISGLLALNCGKSRKIRKAYVELEIKLEINFADALSYSDYEKEKTKFYSENKNSDDYTQLYEEITVKGLKHHYLIRIMDKDPCTVNIYFYIFFCIITLGQIYKVYFSTFCIHKKFTIRKLISTRYDLGGPEFEHNYELMNPQISLNHLKIRYEPNNYLYTDNSYNPNKPTIMELKNAKQYENRIPNYQIYYSEIKDNPDFKNLNDNNTTPYGNEDEEENENENENKLVSGALNPSEEDLKIRLSQL